MTTIYREGRTVWVRLPHADVCGSRWRAFYTYHDAVTYCLDRGIPYVFTPEVG